MCANSGANLRAEVYGLCAISELTSEPMRKVNCQGT
jgi:hypothetical protein